MAPNLDLLLGTEDRLFKLKVQIFAKVGAALGPAAATPAASSKQIPEAEELAENIAKVLKNGGIEPGRASRTAPNSRVPEAVIQRALLAVRQNRVRFGEFLELFFRVRVIGIAIGMIRHRKFAIRTLDFHVGSRARNAQYLVIIAFRIGGQNFPPDYSLEAIV